MTAVSSLLDARRILTVLGAAVIAAVCARVAVLAPNDYRLLLAVSLVSVFLVLTTRVPQVGVLATLLFLPALALVRRLLIADTGWPENDPLILVGPAVAFLTSVRVLVLERRPLVDGRTSGLVAAFLLICFLQAFNPDGGGLQAGLGGLLFFAAPILWFYAGQVIGTPVLVRRVLQGVVVIGLLVAAYGYLQTKSGMPSWDEMWIRINGYEALNVGDSTTRPFASFSSSAEYTLWLAAALIICVGFACHGRTAFLVAVPVLGAAIFFSGTRSALIVAVLGSLVMVGLRTRRLQLAAVVVVVGVLGAAVAQRTYGDDALSAATASGNALAARQVGGLVNPGDSGSSTGGVHLELFLDGLKQGVSDPLGHGSGSTNLGSRLGGSGGGGQAPDGQQSFGVSTEIDVSNAFVALGLVGGLLFLAILVSVAIDAVRRYFRGEDEALAAIGVLVACLGQWLTGGHYALTPLLWFLIGWLCQRQPVAAEVPAAPAPVLLRDRAVGSLAPDA